MIDGTREGEMDAGYMLRVDEPGNHGLCLFVVKGMRRGDRNFKVGFIDAAVHWH